MRHVLSLAFGIVAAPVIWFLVALGQGTPHAGGLLLLGVGVAAGLIATLRTSPLGAMCAGLTFTGASVVLYLKHDRTVELLTTDWEFRGYSVNLATPLTSGVLAFAGGLLLVSMFSFARWRGRKSADDAHDWSPIPAQEAPRWPNQAPAPTPEAWSPSPQAWSPSPAAETTYWPSHSAAPDPEAWGPVPAEQTYNYR
jgi:hypothetical protein